MLVAEVMDALSQLTLTERRLIREVVMDGVSEGEYAKRVGLSKTAVNKRKHRILKKISRQMGYHPGVFSG